MYGLYYLIIGDAILSSRWLVITGDITYESMFKKRDFCIIFLLFCNSAGRQAAKEEDKLQRYSS